MMTRLQLLYCCVFILPLLRMSSPTEKCGDGKIISPVSNTVNMSVNDWVNMTFKLNTGKNCSSPAYVISVERKEQDRPMILCRIHQNKATCLKIGNVATYSCRCVSPSGPVEFWEKLERPGDVEYRWRWTDVSSGKQGEKKINFHVTSGDKKNAQGIQMMNFIIGGAGGLLVVAVVFIAAKCHTSSSSDASHQDAWVGFTATTAIVGADYKQLETTKFVGCRKFNVSLREDFCQKQSS